MQISELEYKNILEDKYSKARLETALGLIKPYLKKATKILDIGVYTGDLFKILPVTTDYYGVDNDEKALKIAQERGVKVCKLDIENQPLSFKSKEFDVIIAMEVLEHMKDPERLIQQISNLLSDGGVVLLSLPNECTILHRFKVMFGRGIDGTAFAPHYHLHFPTLRQNDDFVRKYFKIIKKKYWIHLGTGNAERVLSIFSYGFWLALANLRPSLFARGVIYLCAKFNSAYSGL